MDAAIAVGLAVLILLHVCVLWLLWTMRRERVGADLERLNAGIGQMLYRVDAIRNAPATVDASTVREAIAEHADTLRGVVNAALTAPPPRSHAKPHAPQFALRSQETTGRVARSIYVCEAEDCGHIYYADTPLEGGA